MNRGYRFKLYPTPAQEFQMATQCGMVAGLWNSLLHMQEEKYRRTKGQKGVVHEEGKSIMSEYDMSYLVTALRQSCPEWQSLSTWTPRRVCASLDKAFQAFFRRAKQGAGKSSGYPKYRSYHRGDHNWIPHRFASGCKLSHVRGNSWALQLKGIDGAIHARGRLPADPSKWTNADIRQRNGVWWLSVGVEIEREREHGTGQVVVEIGGCDRVATVNGNPVYAYEIGLMDRESDKIEQLQRKLSEMKRDDPLRHVVRRNKAALEARVARRRRETLHHWTTQLIAGASDIVLVMPESVSEATASGHGDERNWGAATVAKAEFNRAVLNGAPAMVAQMLKYKAEEAGIQIREVSQDHLAVGNLMVDTTKAARKVRRTIRQEKQQWAMMS